MTRGTFRGTRRRVARRGLHLPRKATFRIVQRSHAELSIARSPWQSKPGFLPHLELTALHAMRHIDVRFYDNQGVLLHSNADSGTSFWNPPSVQRVPAIWNPVPVRVESSTGLQHCCRASGIEHHSLALFSQSLQPRAIVALGI